MKKRLLIGGAALAADVLTVALSLAVYWRYERRTLRPSGGEPSADT